MSRPLSGLLVALLLAVLLAPLPARAGPWPRAPGTVFLATTATLDAPDWLPRRSEHYVEYGFRPRLTLGGAVELEGGLRRVDLFARWHPSDLPAGLVWGVTSGLRYSPQGATRARLMAGLDIGRGFDTTLGNLWLRGGARLLAGGDTQTDIDLNAQFGWQRGRWMGIVAVTHYHNRWGGETRLRPALGVEIGRLTLVAEAVLPPGSPLESLRIGLWSEF